MYNSIEGLKSPEKIGQLIKIINIVTGGLIVGFGIFGIIFMALNSIFSGRFFLVFSPIFMIIFGALLLAIELSPSLIQQHFGFLKTLLGRSIFNIYLATQTFYYFGCGSSENYVIAWVTSMILFGLGILYLVLHFTAGSGYAQELKTQIS